MENVITYKLSLSELPPQKTCSLVPFQAIEHLTLHNSAVSVRCGLTIATNLATLPSGGVHCPSTIASMWMLAASTIIDACLPWKLETHSVGYS